MQGEIQAIREGQMPCQKGLVSARGSALEEKGLLGWTATLVRPSDEGLIPIGLMNLTDEPLTLEKGTKYGNFSLTCDNEVTLPLGVSVLCNQRALP